MLIKIILNARKLSIHFFFIIGLLLISNSVSFAQYNINNDPYLKGWSTADGHVLGLQVFVDNNTISDKTHIFVDQKYDPQLYGSKDIWKYGWGLGLMHFTRFPNLPFFWQSEFNYKKSGVGFHFDKTLENETYDVNFNYNYFSLQTGIRFNPIFEGLLGSKVSFLAGFHATVGVSYDIVIKDDLTYKSSPDTLYDSYRERIMESTLTANNIWIFSFGGGYDWHWNKLGLFISYQRRISVDDAITTSLNSVELYEVNRNQFSAHSIKLGITYSLD